MSSSAKTWVLATEFFKNYTSSPFHQFNSYRKIMKVFTYCLHLLHLDFRSSGNDAFHPKKIYRCRKQSRAHYSMQIVFFWEAAYSSEETHQWESCFVLYCPFLVLGGLIGSTGQINLLTENDFDFKHPLVFDRPHSIMVFLLRHMHLKHLLKLRSALRCFFQLLSLPKEKNNSPTTNAGWSSI